MRRDQLEHAIRTACQIIGQPAVVVVGSHAGQDPVQSVEDAGRSVLVAPNPKAAPRDASLHGAHTGLQRR